MPTANDNQVFIRWDRFAVTPDPDSGHYNGIAEVTVSVAGVDVKSFVTIAVTDAGDVVDELINKMEDKRQEYVTA